MLAQISFEVIIGLVAMSLFLLFVIMLIHALSHEYVEARNISYVIQIYAEFYA